MSVFRQGKTVYVGYDSQDMLVDSVLVKQVVLHLSDDLSEIRQIAAENPQLVHMLQGSCNEAGRLHDLKKNTAIGRVASEFVVDMNAGMPQVAERPCRHVFQVCTVRQ